MKKTIFIGQAMPRVKKDPWDWQSLNQWLYSIGIQSQDIQNKFLYTALVDYYPGSKNGSHLVPTKDQIAKEKDRLTKAINTFDPELVVPIGKLSIEYCINKKCLLTECIGKSYFIDPYSSLGKNVKVIPLPHPSGASTWKHNKTNMELLTKALDVLKSEIY